MSSSTIFIKKPLNYRQSIIQFKEKYKEFSPLLTFLLWIFSGLYAASKAGYNPSATGLIVSFSVQDVIATSLASILLYRGLAAKRMLLILPWIGITAYTLYSNHYLGLINSVATLKKLKQPSGLSWAHVSINVILLVIRVTLAIRVLQLCVNLWFKQKLEESKKKTSTYLEK